MFILLYTARPLIGFAILIFGIHTQMSYRPDHHYRPPPRQGYYNSRPYDRPPPRRDDYRTRSRSPVRGSYDRYYDDPREYEYERRRRNDYYEERERGYGYRDERREDRNSSERTSWKKRDLGEPNNHVILQGLSKSLEEHQIQQTLEALEASIESVKLIRDRKTGVSRGFAFAKFTSVEHARQFMETHYPYITLGESRVKIDYSRNSEGGFDEGWTCKGCGILNYKARTTCFHCNIPADQSAPPSSSVYSASASSSSPKSDFTINDGSRDIGLTPNHIILMRGLDNLTTGETLYNALAPLKPKLKRIMLIKDRMSKMSWGFGFLEFNNVQSSTAFLGIVNNRQKYPRGYPVDNRPTTCTFAHPNSFILVYAQSEWTIMGANENILSYWDEQAYPSQFIPSEEEIIPPQNDKMTEKKIVKEETKREQDGRKDVEDELSAFYADVGDILAEGKDDGRDSIFAVPKAKN